MRMASTAGINASDGGRDDEADDERHSPVPPVRFEPGTADGTRRKEAAAEKSATVMTLAADSVLPDLSNESWVISPIRWGGNTGTTGFVLDTPEGGTALTLSNDMNLQVSSFVVAPYIAQWTGSFGTASTQNQFRPETGPKISGDSSTYRLGAAVNLFPVSKFPFSAFINGSRSESQVKGGQFDVRSRDANEPATTLSFGMRQQYRSEDGRDDYSASFDQNNFDSGSTKSTTSGLAGNFSTRRIVDEEGSFLEGEHALTANFGYSSSSSDTTDGDSRTMSAGVNHNWKVHEDLSVVSSLNLISNQGSQFLNDRFVGSNATRVDSSVFLGSSNFSYNFLDLPVSLTGGVNFSITDSNFGGQEGMVQSFASYLSAQYRINNNFSAGANASVALVDNNADKNVVGTVGGNVAYFGDPIKFDKFDYGWNAGAGANAGFFSGAGDNSGDSSFFGANAIVGHYLNRPFLIDQSQTLNLNLNQNLSLLQQSDFGNAVSLSNGFGVTWGARFAEGLSLSLGASANENISFNSDQSGTDHFRSFTLAGNGDYQISRRAVLTFSSNLNWTQSIYGSEQGQRDGDGLLGGNASLVYTHRSPFSIPNLNYRATLYWASQGVEGIGRRGRFDTNLQESGEYRTSTSFLQDIDYVVGRLAFRLNIGLIDQNGSKSTTIFASVNRQFGGFFDGRW